MGNKKGFVLVEAITAVVIVGIGLTLIAQSLLANSHSSLRFQESARMVLAMENRLGFLYASTSDAQDIASNASALSEPYAPMTEELKVNSRSEHLKEAVLTLNWPHTKGQHGFDAATIIFLSPQTKTQSYLP